MTEQFLTLLEEMNKLSLQERVIATRILVKPEEQHNYRFREEILKDFLGIKEDKKNYNPHGEDTKEVSLKSAKKKPTKDKKYSITDSTSLGEFGRIDKEKGHDEKDTVCGIFSELEELLMVVKIIYDENFKKMFNTLRTKKQSLMKDNKQLRDSYKIDFKLIKEYNLSYEILKKDERILTNWSK